MKLFFNGIPSQTKSKELFDLVLDAGSYWFVRPRRRNILACEVLIITDPKANVISHHGLVSVNNEPFGRRIIKKLNGTVFKQTQIQVREYAHRVPGDQRFKEESIGLYRPHDRRRHDLIIERRLFSN